MQLKLLDELVLYVAPTLLGADAAPLLHVSGFGAFGRLAGFRLPRCTAYPGDDLPSHPHSQEYLNVYRNHRRDRPCRLSADKGGDFEIGATTPPRSIRLH